MNSPVADPGWNWWIIWYFYLGGIAAGSYFLATMAELFGNEYDRRHSRYGYLLAAPLIGVCAILLIADLEKPGRFWHMLLDRDSWLPHWKFWSPMSIGAWAVLLFSLISVVSWIGAVAESRFFGWGPPTPMATKLHRGPLGRAFDLLGVVCGFFIASYTGVLLTATNQPIWSDSFWIGALFLASSAGTGLAAIELISSFANPPSNPVNASETRHHEFASTFPRQQLKLHDMEPWIWILEIVCAGFMLHSLGTDSLNSLIAVRPVVASFVGAIGMGIILPAILRWRFRYWKRVNGTVSAISVLIGGFLLRYSLLTAPNAFRALVAFSMNDSCVAG